jgi:hypothetical protein
MKNFFVSGVETIYFLNQSQPEGQKFGLDILDNLAVADQPDMRKLFYKFNSMNEDQEKDPYQRKNYRELKEFYFNYIPGVHQNFLTQMVQPVVSKGQVLSKSPYDLILSPKKSYLNLKEIIAQKKVLIINTAQANHSAETSSLLGSMIINFINKEIGQQGTKDAADRNSVTLIIDEFQTYKGVMWAELLAESRKFGGRVIIGTQTLGSVNDGQEYLVDKIFGGVYSMYVFAVNGQDALYLSEREFAKGAGGPGKSAMTSLELYHCYVRIPGRGTGYSKPFLMNVRTPLYFDPANYAENMHRRADYSLPRKDWPSHVMKNPIKYDAFTNNEAFLDDPYLEEQEQHQTDQSAEVKKVFQTQAGRPKQRPVIDSTTYQSLQINPKDALAITDSEADTIINQAIDMDLAEIVNTSFSNDDNVFQSSAHQSINANVIDVEAVASEQNAEAGKAKKVEEYLTMLSEVPVKNPTAKENGLTEIENQLGFDFDDLAAMDLLDDDLL